MTEPKIICLDSTPPKEIHYPTNSSPVSNLSDFVVDIVDKILNTKEYCQACLTSKLNTWAEYLHFRCQNCIMLQEETFLLPFDQSLIDFECLQ